MHRPLFATATAIALVLGVTGAPASPGASGFVTHHMLFRSMATGKGANAEQLARCEKHVADRTFAIRGSDLDYRVWAMDIASDSGLIVDHNATDLGPGFLCSILPDLAGPDVARSYAYMEFPGLPEIEVEGPCRPTATANSGETFWHCKLEVLPNAATGVVGGFLATNSVLVLGGNQTQWPTGSLWTGYLVTDGLAPPPFTPAPIAAPAGDPHGGAGGHFLAAQESGAPATEGSCASQPLPVGAVIAAVRDHALIAPVTDPANGHLSFAAAAGAPTIGDLSVCYLRTDDREYEVVAVAELVSGDARLLIESAGRCRSYPTVIDADVLFQSCSLHITGPKADGVLSGTLVSGGLVPKARPAESLEPMTWTMFVVRG